MHTLVSEALPKSGVLPSLDKTIDCVVYKEIETARTKLLIKGLASLLFPTWSLRPAAPCPEVGFFCCLGCSDSKSAVAPSQWEVGGWRCGRRVCCASGLNLQGQLAAGRCGRKGSALLAFSVALST